MADDQPKQRLRTTTERDRLGDKSPKKQQHKQKAPTRPLLVVGKLDDLSPSTLTYENLRTGAKYPVSTANVDFRKAKGFDAAIRAAIEQLGFPVARDAEIRLANDKAGVLKVMHGVGKRQFMYLGHARGGAGLAPGGINNALVTNDDITKNLAKGAPPPILLGCFSGEQPIGNPAATKVIGLDRFLKWSDTGAGLARDRNIEAKDVHIDKIELTPYGKAFAPDVGLPPRPPPITPP